MKTWNSKFGRNRVYEEIDFSLLGNNIKMKYSFVKGAGKGLLAFVLFAIPVVINAFPEFMNLTIGGLLIVLVNFFKFKYQNA